MKTTSFAFSCALVFGGITLFRLVTFWLAVEPQRFNWAAALFLFVLSVLCTSGFWLVPYGIRSASCGSRLPRLLTLASQVPMLMLFTTQVIYQFIELFRSGAMSSVAALLFGCAGLGTMGYLAMTLIRTKPLKTLTALKSGDPI